MITDHDGRPIHQGRNIKRFREMLGIKQEALAYELGADWSQKEISLLEQKETVEDGILAQVSEILKIPRCLSGYKKYVIGYSTMPSKHELIYN